MFDIILIMLDALGQHSKSDINASHKAYMRKKNSEYFVLLPPILKSPILITPALPRK